MPNELCKTYSPLPAVPHDCYGRILANTFCTADRKSTRLNSSHDQISYAVFCLKKKKNIRNTVNYLRQLQHKEKVMHVRHQTAECVKLMRYARILRCHKCTVHILTIDRR